MIKWRDDSGKTQRFYLIDKIASEWRSLGFLVGLRSSEIDRLSVEYRENAHECCRAVLGQWLDNPPQDYPHTWEGLMELLEDCKLVQVAAELKTVLAKANI